MLQDASVCLLCKPSFQHTMFSQGPLRISIDPFPREGSNASDESCYSPLSYNSTRMEASPTVLPLCIICSVLCLHDFETDDPDQLKFNRNEILDVVKQEDSGWWAAMRRDEMHVGWIPRTFVEPLSDGMADKLRNVREQLRIYEYEAEVLYHSSAVPNPYQLYYSVPSPSVVSEDWDPLKEGDRPSSLQLVIPTDLVHSPELISQFTSESGGLVNELGLYSADPQSSSKDASFGANDSQADLEELQLDFQETQVNLPVLRNDEKDFRTVKGTRTRLRDPKPLPSPPESASSDSHETKVEHEPKVVHGTKAEPIPINKPTRPTDVDDHESTDLEEETEFPDPVPRSRRRRPLLIKNSVSLNQLSGLLGLRSPHEIDLVMIPGLNGFGDGFDTIVATSRADRINKIKAIDDEALTLFNERIAESHLPWYLRPKYTHDDIKFGNDGNVKAGTLNALIERLTAEPLNIKQEKVFREAFLMTFRTFATPDEVFDLLVGRYETVPHADLGNTELEEWREKKMIPMQSRVLIIFTMWLQDYGLLDEEPHIASRLATFLASIASPSSLMLTAKLILRDLERLTVSRPSASHWSSLKRSRKVKPHKNDLLRLDPAHIAEQLCLIEHELYRKICSHECINWVKTQTGPMVSNLQKFHATHDRLAAWVKASILNVEGLGRRADMVDFWIKVTEKCRSYQNYSSMSALIAALSSTVITRLNATWTHSRQRGQIDALLKLNEPVDRFSTYRTLAHTAEGPCVPFVRVFLTDILDNNDQIADSFPSPSNPDVNLICFSKRQRLYEIVSTMLRHQSKTYSFAENEAMKTSIEGYLQSAGAITEDWFWTRSQEVQLSELAHVDIRKALEAVGL